MKTLTLKHLLLPVFIAFAGSAFNQTVSIPPIADFDHNAFGTEITIPINIEDFQLVIGDFIGGNLTIEYNASVLEYVSYDNLMNPGIFEGVNSAIPGVLTFAWFDLNFDSHPFPDGKIVDINFNYYGGTSDFVFTDVAWFDENFDDWTLNGGATGLHFTYAFNGSISGFAPLTGSNGAWDNTDTWTGEFGSLTQPGPGHNVTIQTGGTITIGADAKANSITIQSGGQLTQSSDELTVMEDLTIESGGSFIQQGTLDVGGDIMVQRHITAASWAEANDGWHLLSSPMTTHAISGDFTPNPATSYDFYGWDEGAQTWRNFNGGNFTGWNGSDNFVPGRGYMVAYEQTSTKTFTGTLNSADVIIPVVRGGSDEYVGYNLVGNPYPSALTWGTGWDLTNIAGTAHVWDRATKAYIERTAGQPIPAMNGFMVYLQDAATPNLTIPEAARAHNAANWFKSSDERIVLIAHNPADGSAQRTLIRFDQQATEGFDLAYDGYFLEGYAPKFYSLSNDLMFSVNTLPVLEDEMSIPLGFEKTASANYYIELAETITGENIYLTDLKTNTTVLLSDVGQYHFTAEDGDDLQRFKLSFGALDVAELQTPQIWAYAYGQTLFVHDLRQTTQIELYNQMGQRVHSLQTDGLGTQQFMLDLPAGVYVVRLSNATQSASAKVIIQ